MSLSKTVTGIPCPDTSSIIEASSENQLLVSTHSENLLNSFEIEDIRNFAKHVFNKYKLIIEKSNIRGIEKQYLLVRGLSINKDGEQMLDVVDIRNRYLKKIELRSYSQSLYIHFDEISFAVC